VILRGNNRGAIFSEEADYRFYLDKLQLACRKHGCDIHAYVLMTNHVHLLITPYKSRA
jgi:putative transposase